MKKLVTLMLALSLGGSQVFAAGSSAQEKSPAANLAIGGAIAATLLYLIAPRREFVHGKIEYSI